MKTTLSRPRDGFGSGLGALAAMLGSAVGLGNIWKFPYLTGENGGAAFVLTYLACVVLVGLPVMVAEDPVAAVVLGAGRVLDDLGLLRSSTVRY